MTTVDEPQEIDTGTTDLIATRRDGVLTLTLNRPERRNAMTPAMIAALAAQSAVRARCSLPHSPAQGCPATTASPGC
jgi:1,4-dihydroxy-2-naphthoyl-CoA synthase